MTILITKPLQIHRGNIARLLDSGQIEIHMQSGKWWSIRRNGMTKLWKKSVSRIRIPYKYGMWGYGQITEDDFDDLGVLNPNLFRIAGT